MRLHRRVEIGIFGFHIIEDVRVIDDRIARVAQPEPGIGERLAVQGDVVRALFGDRSGGQGGAGGQVALFLLGKGSRGKSAGRGNERGGNCGQEHPNSTHHKTPAASPPVGRMPAM